MILGVGAFGPLGTDALAVAMCARAAKIEPRPTRILDRRGHRISVVRALSLPDELQGLARLVALGAPALREAAARLDGDPVPLVVAAPDLLAHRGGGAGDPALASAELLAALAAESGAPVDMDRSAVVHAGEVGFALALALALELLEDPSTPAVLVGGVDSYYDEPRITALDRAARLCTLEQQEGMTPSEGAAFLLIGREGQGAPLGRVRFVASAPAGASASASASTKDAPVDAAIVGLIEAASRAAGPPPWVLTDVNGEPRRKEAWAAVEARIQGALAEPVRHDRWAEELGDLGAAAGAALAALACVFWSARCAPAPAALIALHADGGERAALVLEAVSPPARASTPPPLAGVAAEPAVAVPDVAPPRPFRASVGAPAVHRIVGAGDGDGDGDAAAAAPPPPPPPPLTDALRVQMRRMARDCMEDIAIFGDLWRQRQDEPASVAAGLEQRVLDNLDAVMALVRRRPAPEAVKELLRAADEITFPDRGRGFAVALVLGSLEGEEGAQAAISAMRRAHPGTLLSWDIALRLGSSPALPGAMARLLRSERTPLVRLALEVLRARRAADFEALAPLLLHADARVRAAAARCAASALAPEIARPLLEGRLDDSEEPVALAAAESLLLLGPGPGASAGVAWLRARLAEDPAALTPATRELRAQAARLLAITGGEGDLPLLLAVVGNDPRAADLLGWYGHPGAIPSLLDLLDHVSRAIASHEPVRGAELAVARALHRITGAPPATDVATWRATLDASGRDLSARARLRFGEPYTPAATLRELERDDTPLRIRREAALEAAVCFGLHRRVDVDGWTALQRTALASLRASLERESGELPPHPPGAWPADLRAR